MPFEGLLQVICRTLDDPDIPVLPQYRLKREGQRLRPLSLGFFDRSTIIAVTHLSLSLSESAKPLYYF
jgi:hypothetical protein